jgi:peptidase E
VLYFPNEKVTTGKIKSGMYEARLAAFGFRTQNIYVANYFEPAPYFGLDIDIVYISGGNTFGTMKWLRDTGFDRAIVDYVCNGVIYIGGSAGAHIATADISHVKNYDEDTFGLSDFSGLGLYDGILICHYTDERKQHAKELRRSGTYSVTTLTNKQSVFYESKNSNQ